MSTDEGEKFKDNAKGSSVVPPSGDSAAAVIGRVAFKAPVFWESDPALWFGQVESQFVIAGLSSDTTKFHAVVAALEPKVLNCVRDLVINPPAKEAYEALKKRILNFYERSESSKLKLLLNDLQLGDRRPSQLFCEMEALNNGKISQGALRALWMQRLPNSVQQILSVCSDDITESSKLAQVADKVYEGSQFSGSHLAVVEAGNSGIESLRNDIADLQKAVTEMQVNSLSTKTRNNRGRSRSRIRSRSPSTTRQNDYCWYHAKFGVRAHQCRSPCKWSEN